MTKKLPPKALDKMRTRELGPLQTVLYEGVDWREIDEGGKNLLYHALFGYSEEQTDWVRLLLAYGAHPNRVDKQGKTPLYWATCMDSSAATIDLLLLYGAQWEKSRLPQTLKKRFSQHPAHLTYTALGECLYDARKTLAQGNVVPLSTQKKWETLATNHPGIATHLLQLCPQAHFAIQYLFGSSSVQTFSTADKQAYAQYTSGQHASHTLPSEEQPIQPKLPAIRRAVIHYLLSSQESVPYADAAFSVSINRALLEHLHFDAPSGNWAVSHALKPYWETACAGEPHAEADTAQHLFLLQCEAGLFNDFQQEPDFIAKLQSVEASLKSLSPAPYGLNTPFFPGTTGLQRLLQNSKRLAQWAHVAILSKPEDSACFRQLQQEMCWLLRCKFYPVTRDLQYFFTKILRAAWEENPDLFQSFAEEQICNLLTLAQQAEPLKTCQLPAAHHTHAYWTALKNLLANKAPTSLPNQSSAAIPLYNQLSNQSKQSWIKQDISVQKHMESPSPHVRFNV